MTQLASAPVRLLSLASVVVTAVVGFAALAVTSSSPSTAATCADVDIAFARGTGEAQGFGSVGPTFVNAVEGALPGRTFSTYAVVYDANTAQTSAAPGSTDLTNHITSVAASCPGTRFILSGYSQGATVVDKSLGIRTGSGTGTTIPSSLAPRVAAVVVFGNPLGAQGQTIATASPTYGPRSRDYCNTGDPVCGGGNNVGAHLQYVSNGSAADGGRYAASLVPAAGPTSSPTSSPTVSPTASPTSGPTTKPTTKPTTTPTAAATCVRASNRDHVEAGRAVRRFGRAYAIGSNDSLGSDSSYTFTSLRQTNSTTWKLVSSC